MEREWLVHGASGPVGTDLASWAAAQLGALGWTADGLYVATSTAGRWESVEFWRAACETGLAFANPRLFPWTLANSPTGSIARALDIRGPTYTLVGRAQAVAGVLEHSADDLIDGLVTTAAVVAVDAQADGCPVIAAVLVSSGRIARLLRILVDDVGDAGRPVDILARVCAAARSANVDRPSVHSGNV